MRQVAFNSKGSSTGPAPPPHLRTRLVGYPFAAFDCYSVWFSPLIESMHESLQSYRPTKVCGLMTIIGCGMVEPTDAKSRDLHLTGRAIRLDVLLAGSSDDKLAAADYR